MNLRRFASTVYNKLLFLRAGPTHSCSWLLLHVFWKVFGLPTKDWPKFWTFVHRINLRLVRNCSPDYLVIILWRHWARNLAEYKQVYRFWMIAFPCWINKAWLMFCAPQEFRKSDRTLYLILIYLESHLSYMNFIPLFFFHSH